MVCHFYRNATERCQIFDMHLGKLAQAHPETRFVKIDAEKAPFLCERLRIIMLPTLALVVKGKVKDYIVGFDDLGGDDDFDTEVLEWRLGQSGMLDYTGAWKYSNTAHVCLIQYHVCDCHSDNGTRCGS